MIEPALSDAVYFAGGALRGGTLGKDTVVDGVPCKGGEIVELHENGRLESAWLAADVTLGGVPCTGDAPIDFYPSGALKWARLARPHRVGEVPCAQGSPIFLHPEGTLWNGELADSWRRDGRAYEAGTRVTLDPAGRVLEWSSEGGDVEGLPCRGDFDVWRYADGRLSNIVLAGPAVIDGVTYAANTEIDLDEQGHVESAVVMHLEEGVRYKRRVHGRIVPGR